MTFPRLATAISLLAFATLSLDAAHAAEPAIQASTSLSGLSYRVIDLAPNDGITAQVTFTSGLPLLGMVDYSRPSSSQTISVGGAPFNVEPGGFDGGPGEVSGRITSTGQSLSLSVQGDQIVNPAVTAKVDQQIEANPYLNPSLYGAGGQIYTMSPGIRWEITPRTALVVEGQLSAELALQLSGIDRSQLAPYIEGQGRRFSLNVQAYTGVSLLSDLWLSDPLANNPGPISSAGASFDRQITWGPEGDHDQGESDDQPESRAFTLTINNTGGQRMAGKLYLESRLNTWAQLSQPPFDPTSSVPEPSTYLLFILGVAGLSLARRRTPARA